MSAKSSRPSPKVKGPVVAGNMALWDDASYTLVDGGAPGGGGGGSGTVTNTGTLTADVLIVGNGGVDVKSLGDAGSTTTVLHGGSPNSFAAVDLTADVTGDLPFSNFVQASAASKLVGRGSASGAGDFEEISLGTGLSMSGTTLSATGTGGTVTTTGSPASGNLTKFSGATSITNGDLSGDVTTSGTLATTIANNAITTAKITDANVTLAKIANAAANSKLLGSGASGSGAAYSEITLGATLTMTGTTLNTTGVSAADIVVGGTTITSGTSGRVLYDNAGVLGETADIPLSNLVAASGGSLLVGRRAGSSGDFEEISLGSSGLSMSSTTLNNTRTVITFVFGATSGWNPGDAVTAYFGQNIGFNPTATTDGGFRVACPITGTVKAVFGEIQVTGTLGSAGINSTFTVRNVTANTTEDISTTVPMNSVTNDFSNESMTLAVTKGDMLLIKVVTGTWATNPTAVFGYFTMVLI